MCTLAYLRRKRTQKSTHCSTSLRDVQLQAIVEQVHEALVEKPSWLLIYDNADDEEAVLPYIPPTPFQAQHIIVTSRSQQWEEDQVGDWGWCKTRMRTQHTNTHNIRTYTYKYNTSTTQVQHKYNTRCGNVRQKQKQRHTQTHTTRSHYVPSLWKRV